MTASLLGEERKICDGDPLEVPHGRIPRVSRLMALAIRFEKLVRDGVVADYAELARLGTSLGHAYRGF